jgi:SulP family sulfate permease
LLPIAALVGVMIMVAIGTFEWISFRIIKNAKHDIFVGVLVAIITILLHNLALAVLIGVIISALVLLGRCQTHSCQKISMIKGLSITDQYG